MIRVGRCGGLRSSTISRAGLGQPPHADLWLYQGDAGKLTAHIAFQVNQRAMVDAFYQAAIAAGGKDNGKPGPRPHYSANYYGAFILDPDGYNIEAVCREAQ